MIDGEDIVYRDYVDISVAVATPKGLVVPVIRGVDRMGFADVEKKLGELVSRGAGLGRVIWRRAGGLVGGCAAALSELD